VRPSRAVLVAIALALMPAGAARAASTALLPDLVQAYPREVQVETDAGSGTARYHLAFLSSVDNRGGGPLIVHGHRDNAIAPGMTADQLVANENGTRTTHPRVGRLVYVDAITHRHWHYLGFDRYELRRPSGYALVTPDQKSGFCLGDRYDAFPDSRLRAEPPSPVYTGNCAPDDPGAAEVTEGMSVGYGDDYPPIKEGQFVDVTGVPAGRYYLVHRVNADRSLLETDYSNDASSLLVALAWPHGMQSPPTVTVLNTCRRSRRCPIPRMTERKASGFARGALTRALHHSVTPVLACRVRSPAKATCRASVARGRHRYTGTVGVAYRIRDGLPWWTYVVALRGLPRVHDAVPLY
jgi:lysyl oxidase